MNYAEAVLCSSACGLLNDLAALCDNLDSLLAKRGLYQRLSSKISITSQK